MTMRSVSRAAITILLLAPACGAPLTNGLGGDGSGSTGDGGGPFVGPEASVHRGGGGDGGGSVVPGSDGGAGGGCGLRTCGSAGANCGPIGDGCGGVIECGSCGPGELCGGNGHPSVCSGTSGPGTPSCTNLCLKQVECDVGGTTTMSGTVYAPNGVDPIYDALVYVPNGTVEPFPPGVACDACGAPASGDPLVSAITGVDGSFKIENVPVGSNIPVVIQIGRWRRLISVAVSSCVDNPLPASSTRLPKKEAELNPLDNIPLIAFVTGSADPMECSLRKFGIADSEFTNPSGSGRVQIYQDNGANIDGSTPAATSLYSASGTLDKYDIVVFACTGAPEDQSAYQANVIGYANAGGRIFATHYSYDWLYNDPPFSTTAAWNPDRSFSSLPDPLTAFIDTSFPKGMALAEWLTIVGASTTAGQIPVNQPRWDFDSATPPSQQWLYRSASSGSGTTPLDYTFNTPVGSAAGAQCGRVLFSDFHVNTSSSSGGIFCGGAFPSECDSSPMTPQEKLLEFMFFDLSNCVAPDMPPPSTCTPLTCAGQGFNCGKTADGCGGLLDCGTCTAPDTCGGSGKANVCGKPLG